MDIHKKGKKERMCLKVGTENILSISNIEAGIKEGTTIAILGNKISSKEKHDKLFSGVHHKDIETAEKAWEEAITFIKKHYEVEIIEKYYPSIDITRRELTVLGGIK